MDSGFISFSHFVTFFSSSVRWKTNLNEYNQTVALLKMEDGWIRSASMIAAEKRICWSGVHAALTCVRSNQKQKTGDFETNIMRRDDKMEPQLREGRAKD